MEENSTQVPKRSEENACCTLTVAEAADLLGISRGLCYELAHQGVLPAIRLGRRIIVSRPRLLAMIGMPPAREK